MTSSRRCPHLGMQTGDLGLPQKCLQSRVEKRVACGEPCALTKEVEDPGHMTSHDSHVQSRCTHTYQ